ncbi:MAG: hypothetical protein AAEJ53_16280 [Myxococcota bacterium]
MASWGVDVAGGAGPAGCPPGDRVYLIEFKDVLWLDSLDECSQISGPIHDKGPDRIVRKVAKTADREGAFSRRFLRPEPVADLNEHGHTELGSMKENRHESSAMVKLYTRSIDAKLATPLWGAW